MCSLTNEPRPMLLLPIKKLRLSPYGACPVPFDYRMGAPSLALSPAASTEAGRGGETSRNLEPEAWAWSCLVGIPAAWAALCHLCHLLLDMGDGRCLAQHVVPHASSVRTICIFWSCPLFP